MYDFLLVRHCDYSSILYHLRVIWHWIIPWPWNLAYRSLKIIEIGAIQKLRYGFPFAFHGAILYRLWDNSDLLVENPEIYILHLYLVPPLEVTGDPVRISWRCLMLIKTRMIELYRTVRKKYDDTLSSFHTIPERNGRPDGRTDRFAISISHVSMLTRDKNCK